VAEELFRSFGRSVDWVAVAFSPFGGCLRGGYRSCPRLRRLGSIGIQIGGIGALIPERRNELAKLGVRAMLTGTMANLILTVIAGMFWGNVRIQPERLGTRNT